MIKKKIIIIISSIVVVCAGGITAACVLLNQHKPMSESEKNEILSTRSFEWYENYFDRYGVYMNNSALNLFRDGLTDDAKLFIAYHLLRKGNVAGSFSYDEINAAYTSLFSGDFPRLARIKNSRYCMPSFIYNESTKVYEDDNVLGGCGGADTSRKYSRIMSTIDFGDHFIIRVVHGEAIAESANSSDGRIKGYKVELAGGKTDFIENTNVNYDADDYMESKYTKLKKYDFYFVKRNDNYVLEKLIEVDPADESIANIEEAAVRSYERHSSSWYEKNTENQIVVNDLLNIFKDPIDDKARLYIALAKITDSTGYYYSVTQFYYLNLNSIYEKYNGVSLKKQDYDINECYKLTYNGDYFYNAAYKEINGETLDGISVGNNYLKKCGTNQSKTYYYYEVSSVEETESGYNAIVHYINADFHSDDETSAVWYTLNGKNTEKKFDCGYDYGSCKIEKIKEYIDDNPDELWEYELVFETVNDAESLREVNKI